MESPRFESEINRSKRQRQEEESFHEEDYFNNVKQQCSLSDLLIKDDDDAVFAAENLDYDQELISGVMKSLAEEITGSNPTVPSSEPPAYLYDSTSGENPCNAASNVDLEYLLGATDDELGIPPSPNYLAENQVINDVLAENPAEDLFEIPRPEPQTEAFLQFSDSDSLYLSYEYEPAMLNDSLYQDWQTRSLEGDAITDCYAMDNARLRLLESGVRL